MEVAARRTGDSLTPRASGNEEARGSSRLNASLYVLAVVCLGLAVVLSVLMSNAHRADGGDRSGGWFADVVAVVKDEQVVAATDARAGQDVGGGVVEALSTASEEEQERIAAQLESATKMVNAFLNIDHEQVEANIEAVKELATGPFLRQYTRASKDLAALTRRAKATQTGEVVWAGLVAGDADDATVIAATTGTVANKVTDFEPQARTYRLQLDLEFVDGQWLTSDLQYVE